MLIIVIAGGTSSSKIAVVRKIQQLFSTGKGNIFTCNSNNCDRNHLQNIDKQDIAPILLEQRERIIKLLYKF